MKLRKILFFIVLSLLLAHCASDFSSNLEEARFALDKSDFDKAIEAAEAALEANPGNIEATRILASAHFGKSGLDFFDLAGELINLQNKEEDETNFIVVGNILSESVTISELRTAIVELEKLEGIDDDPISNEDLADAVFDLAIMQAIEHFALGIYGSDFFTATGSTVDPSSISSDDASAALDDLVDFDNRLIGSGLDSDNDFISQIRQTYCILRGLSGTDEDGFTLEEFQALVGCELSSDASAFSTIFAGIENCAALDPNDQSADVEDCYNNNTPTIE